MPMVNRPVPVVKTASPSARALREIASCELCHSFVAAYFNSLLAKLRRVLLFRKLLQQLLAAAQSTKPTPAIRPAALSRLAAKVTVSRNRPAASLKSTSTASRLAKLTCTKPAPLQAAATISSYNLQRLFCRYSQPGSGLRLLRRNQL
jgi:hypothetical protein